MAKKQTAKQDEKPEKSEKAARAETAPAKEEKPAKKEKEARKAKEPKAKTSPAAPPGESAATAAPAPAPAPQPQTATNGNGNALQDNLTARGEDTSPFYLTDLGNAERFPPIEGREDEQIARMQENAQARLGHDSRETDPP